MKALPRCTSARRSGLQTSSLDPSCIPLSSRESCSAAVSVASPDSYCWVINPSVTEEEVHMLRTEESKTIIFNRMKNAVSSQPSLAFRTNATIAVNYLEKLVTELSTVLVAAKLCEIERPLPPLLVGWKLYEYG